MRSLLKNKKGFEFSPAFFFTLIVVVFIIAPVILLVMREVTTNTFSSLNDSSPQAVDVGEFAVNKVRTFFDILIVIGITISLLMLFISAFFIDTNPVWLLVYIIFAFVFVLIMPHLIDVIDRIWNRFPTDTTALPLTNFLRENLVVFIIAVIFLTGVIMYAKYKSFSKQWG